MNLVKDRENILFYNFSKTYNRLDKIIYKNMLKIINEKDFNVKYKII